MILLQYLVLLAAGAVSRLVCAPSPRVVHLTPSGAQRFRCAASGLGWQCRGASASAAASAAADQQRLLRFCAPRGMLFSCSPLKIECLSESRRRRFSNFVREARCSRFADLETWENESACIFSATLSAPTPKDLPYFLGAGLFERFALTATAVCGAMREQEQCIRWYLFFPIRRKTYQVQSTQGV